MLPVTQSHQSRAYAGQPAAGGTAAVRNIACFRRRLAGAHGCGSCMYMYLHCAEMSCTPGRHACTGRAWTARTVISLGSLCSHMPCMLTVTGSRCASLRHETCSCIVLPAMSIGSFHVLRLVNVCTQRTRCLYDEGQASGEPVSAAALAAWAGVCEALDTLEPGQCVAGLLPPCLPAAHAIYTC